jgi:hypothetical protein
MESVSYNGAVFNVIETLACTRERIYDEANNYLWTAWRFTVRTHWNPRLVAYNVAGGLPPQPGYPIGNFVGVPGVPVLAPGTYPGITDLSLLNYLLQPRGLLRVLAGGMTILETPALVDGWIPPTVSGPTGQLFNPDPPNGRYPCDCTGGPSVKIVSVNEIMMLKDWLVTLQFSADVRDVEPGQSTVEYDPNSEPPVLNAATNGIISNLWVGQEDIDKQRRSVRRFAGKAILRADVIRQARVNANTFRDLYLFPTMNHYQRENVHVQISEDGTECLWSFEDRMRGYDLGDGVSNRPDNESLPNSQILDIECWRTASVSRGSPAKLAFDTVRGLSRAGSIAAAPAALVVAALDNLPKSYRHCRTEILGDRNADLGRLTIIAFGICMQQIGFGNIATLLTGTHEIIIRQDIGDEVRVSVEMSTMFTDDGVLGALINAAAAIPAIPNLILNPNQQWPAFVPALALQMNAASMQMCAAMTQDSRSLTILDPPAPQPQPAPALVPGDIAAPAPGPTTVIATREGAGAILTNPPLLQGAFGQVCQETVLDVAGLEALQVTAADAAPQGIIPQGVHNFIVQAIMGQFGGGPAPFGGGYNPLNPPLPGALVNES